MGSGRGEGGGPGLAAGMHMSVVCTPAPIFPGAPGGTVKGISGKLFPDKLCLTT